MKCQNPHPTETSETCGNEATRKLEIDMPNELKSYLYVCSLCASMFLEHSVSIVGKSN